ncbi:hypothetical protein JANAI62_37610 [Jannaschia pagri]|uniref:Uncharacterized protein n=1 Tax=Jannaschia pagri TaxID=2829797 RepID=A0ABQ4NRV3_9RHOB|nr:MULTISPECIES: hypothetical protein [unclassified Jannaschia]GIT93332.1 hypothetical protein JANAI61_37900 [Jannaschia sp. AI_61]GIT97138.1 hypothetical protein JANAI62_37610 [Jannaschia sp. AI_62]
MHFNKDMFLSIFKLFHISLFFGVMVTVATNAKADVRCKCPSISAEGEGNSSCSANESGGTCTIDFNLFGVREVRASEFLSEQLEPNFQPFPNQNTVDSLRQAEESGILFDQVFMYLNVAAISQGTRNPESVPLSEIESLFSLASEFQKEIEFAFSQQVFGQVMSGSLVFPTDMFVDMGEVVISPGCVEILHSGQWLMFKTHWSLAAEAPGCSS